MLDLELIIFFHRELLQSSKTNGINTLNQLFLGISPLVALVASTQGLY